MKKLNYINTFKEVITCYKKNFKDLLFAGLIVSVTNFLISTLSNLTFNISNGIVNVIVNVVILSSVISLLFYLIRATCGSIIYSDDLYNNRATSLKYKIYDAKNRMWKYVSALIVLFGIIVAFSFIVMIMYTFFSDSIIKYILIAIVIACGLFTLMRYYFTPYFRLFEPFEKDYMVKSVQLLKGNFIVFSLLMFTFNILPLIYYVFSYIIITDLPLTIFQDIGIDFLFNGMLVFINPLVWISYSVIYKKLR